MDMPAPDLGLIARKGRIVARLSEILPPDAVIDAAVDEYAALARRITLVDADDVQALLNQPRLLVLGRWLHLISLQILANPVILPG